MGHKQDYHEYNVESNEYQIIFDSIFLEYRIYKNGKLMRELNALDNIKFGVQNLLSLIDRSESEIKRMQKINEIN